MNFKNHSNRQPQRAGMTATPVPTMRQMQIDYGHDDKGNVVITFNQDVRNLYLTPAQADELVAAVDEDGAGRRRRCAAPHGRQGLSTTSQRNLSRACHPRLVL